MASVSPYQTVTLTYYVRSGPGSLGHFSILPFFLGAQGLASDCVTYEPRGNSFLCTYLSATLARLASILYLSSDISNALGIRVERVVETVDLVRRPINCCVGELSIPSCGVFRKFKRSIWKSSPLRWHLDNRLLATLTAASAAPFAWLCQGLLVSCLNFYSLLNWRKVSEAVVWDYRIWDAMSREMFLEYFDDCLRILVCDLI